MTDTTRLDLIQTTLTQILTNSPTSEGGKAGIERLNELDISTNEWLALAFRPQKLPADFDPAPFLVDPVDEDEKWENQQRVDRELDDILSSTAVKDKDETEEEEDHDCFTCGAACVSYNVGDETYWLCEECYYGNTESEYGNCGSICDGHCPTCDNGGGYDGADEI